ncbi:hypothetical protein EON66_00550, partial [archaeon]
MPRQLRCCMHAKNAHSTYARHAVQDDAVPASVEGVLGGEQHVAPWDAVESRQFVEMLQREVCMGAARALDVGAGIGRVTQDVLRHYFQGVDVMEPSPKMLHAARVALCGHGGVDEPTPGAATTACADMAASSTAVSTTSYRFIQSGIHDFSFEPDVLYDCIWLQWVIGCASDVQLIDFLRAAGSALAPHGCQCGPRCQIQRSAHGPDAGAGG